ncbi:Core histone H2A/H2B/H3/H4 [Geosmithia morbida]|uniref:Core histone H2A/H2B/H3/H4 n=1 Tax=Geosmithia morbida TaxID=1094350 RepID=A0A9P5D294_9HYPO|nr:Core histone H2A/H2B/H3/H4 [Geosmithia morbida]KAF4124788.1 Core histone H2A/H2B/H3/H4 [Geosmithia morbida]
MESTPKSNRPTGRTPGPARTPIGRTPVGRASTAEPPSSRPSVHTPLDRTTSRDLLNSVRRAASVSASGGPQGGQSNAPTPHAKLAQRALHDRRTAVFTPGKNRRRSLMDQRETPMDILRNLGRKLAPTSKRVSTSSSISSASSSAGAPDTATPPSRSGHRRQRRRTARSSDFTQPIPEERAGHDDDDDDDEEDLRPPRLSLPIDRDDDDDEEELRPPRPSMLEDFDYTVASVELPRRMDFGQQAAGRLSRGSLGSLRPSDVFEGNQMMSPDVTGRQSDFFPEQVAEDVDEYQRIDADPTRRSSLGRVSDFGLEMPEGLDGQTTFVMSEPGDDAPPTSPIAQDPTGLLIEEQEATGAVAANAADAAPPPPTPAPAPAPFSEGRSPPTPLPLDDFSDREPLEDIPDGSDDGDDGDREPLEDIPDHSDDGDREPVEDIPERSDGGGDVPMDDGGFDDDAAGGYEEYAENVAYAAAPEMSPVAATAPAARAPAPAPARQSDVGHVRIREALPPRRKRKLVSRHGIEYPSLPPAFVKRVAQTALQSSGLSNPRVSTDTLTALIQASEWYFEQLGDDLGAYANHAKRKTIEESDVVTLMRRQRQIGSTSTVFSLAQKHMPRELLQELRMPIAQTTKKRRGEHGADGEEEEEEEEDDT